MGPVRLPGGRRQRRRRWRRQVVPSSLPERTMIGQGGHRWVPSRKRPKSSAKMGLV